VNLILSFGLFLFLAIAANLLLKIGSSSFNIKNPINLSNLQVYLGMLSFGAALLIWVYILKKMPLNVAQAFSVLQFIGVVLASWLLLNEPISFLR